MGRISEVQMVCKNTKAVIRLKRHTKPDGRITIKICKNIYAEPIFTFEFDLEEFALLTDMIPTEVIISQMHKHRGESELLDEYEDDDDYCKYINAIKLELSKIVD